MDAQNYWYSSGAAGGGGGGDPGDPIGQSLRFRGGQRLIGTPVTVPSGAFTLSFWLKRGDNNSETGMMSLFIGSPNFGFQLGNSNQTPPWRMFSRISGAQQLSNGSLTDYSAWYHCVFSTTGGNTTFYLNGETQLTTASPASANTVVIGSNAEGKQDDALRAYLADYHCIDGQALLPTSFGRFNDDGVWVPVDYDGDADDYGANGFHLTFEDPDNLGEDTAPIGTTGHTAANNFTATGFDTAPVGIFSNDLFTYQASQAIVDNGPSAANLASTDKVFSAGSPATNGFNGNSGNYALSNNTGLAWVWRPSTPIENVTQIDIRGLSGQPVYINGTVSATRLNDAQQTVYNGAAITLETLSGLPATAGDVWQSGGSAGFGAIWINGSATPLVDNTGTDYDLMQDSPTQNWATLNPVLEPTNQTLSDANLTGGTSSTATSLTTQLPDYQYYWEGLGSNYYYGISEIDAVRDNYLGSKANQVGWFNDGSFWVGTNNVGTFGPSFATTDVAMQAYDPATGNYWVGINGTWHGGGDPENGTNPAFTVSADFRERMLPASNVSSGTNSYNFGQQPFVFPVPNGFSALQTQNMPAAPIANGRDHFVVHLDPGAAILPAAQGLFPNGLWWIKSLVNPDGQINQHQISNSVLPADSWGQCPGNFNAFEAYQAPDSDSVAWCWGGDEVTGADLTAVNANGDLDLIGLVRNVDAGMSSGYYNGSPDGTTQTPGTQLTFPHGLSQAPEFVVVSLMDDNGAGSTNTWQAYSSSPDTRAERGLILRSADAGFDPDFFWTTQQEATTNTLIRVRVAPSALVSNDANRRRTCGYNSNYFFMAFHSVPGYSAFGSYTGTGNADGPFIYTGFRPAFIMLKSSTNAFDWQIYDSTRSINNPAMLTLSPNQPASEVTGGNNLDILSNGFKPRDNGSINNNSGATYAYACFSENPFQAPVTAR